MVQFQKNVKKMRFQVNDKCLQEKFFDLLLDVGDLRFELGALVLRDAGGNHWARHPAGPAQRLLGPHEHVRYILQQGPAARFTSWKTIFQLSDAK